MVWQRSRSPILTSPYPSIIWPLVRSTPPSLSHAASQSTSNSESGASSPGTGSPGASNAESQKQVQQCKWCLVSGRGGISWCNQSLACAYYETRFGIAVPRTSSASWFTSSRHRARRGSGVVGWNLDCQVWHEQSWHPTWHPSPNG